MWLLLGSFNISFPHYNRSQDMKRGSWVWVECGQCKTSWKWLCVFATHCILTLAYPLTSLPLKKGTGCLESMSGESKERMWACQRERDREGVHCAKAEPAEVSGLFPPEGCAQLSPSTCFPPAQATVSLRETVKLHLQWYSDLFTPPSVSVYTETMPGYPWAGADCFPNLFYS